MNKFYITFLAILATGSIAAADFGHFNNPLSKLKVGRYVCNYQPQNRYSRSISNKCVINIDK